MSGCCSPRATFIVLNSGGLVSFGAPWHGHPTFKQVYVPDYVAPFDGRSDAIAVGVDASQSHGAVVTSSGELYTFGEDVFGSLLLQPAAVDKLGITLAPTQRAVKREGKATAVLQPTRVDFEALHVPKWTVQLGVKPTIRVRQVACGNGFTMLCDTEGRAWSVGFNAGGQCGVGTWDASSRLSLVRCSVEDSIRFRPPVPGELETIEVGEDEGSAADMPFPSRRDAGIALGGKERLAGPIRVHPGLPIDAIAPAFGTSKYHIDEVVRGYRESAARRLYAKKMGVTIDAKGKVTSAPLAFGKNPPLLAELDDGLKHAVSKAPRIEVPPTVVSVSAGAQHAALLASDGYLYTCGWGQNGRLGHGDQVARNVAVRVSKGIPDSVRFTQAQCGSAHTVALSTDGRVYSFGANDHGQLGAPFFLRDAHGLLVPTTRH